MGTSEQTDAPHGAALARPHSGPAEHQSQETRRAQASSGPTAGTQGAGRGDAAATAYSLSPRGPTGVSRPGPALAHSLPRLQTPCTCGEPFLPTRRVTGQQTTQPPMTLPEMFTDLGAPKGRREKVRDFRGSSTLCSPHVNYSPH